MEAVIKEKIKRRTDDVTDGHSVKKRKKAVNKDNSETGDLSVEEAAHREGGVKDASLASLVKSVKAKTHNFKSKTKRWQDVNESKFLLDARYVFRPRNLLWYKKLSWKREFHVFNQNSHCKIKRKVAMPQEVKGKISSWLSWNTPCYLRYSGIKAISNENIHVNNIIYKWTACIPLHNHVTVVTDQIKIQINWINTLHCRLRNINKALIIIFIFVIIGKYIHICLSTVHLSFSFWSRCKQERDL